MFPIKKETRVWSASAVLLGSGAGDPRGSLTSAYRVENIQQAEAIGLSGPVIGRPWTSCEQVNWYIKTKRISAPAAGRNAERGARCGFFHGTCSFYCMSGNQGKAGT